MGSDLYFESKRSSEKRGGKYVWLKRELCRILELECVFDETGPGEYRGVSDVELVNTIKDRITTGEQNENRHSQQESTD